MTFGVSSATVSHHLHSIGKVKKLMKWSFMSSMSIKNKDLKFTQYLVCKTPMIPLLNELSLMMKSDNLYNLVNGLTVMSPTNTYQRQNCISKRFWWQFGVYYPLHLFGKSEHCCNQLADMHASLQKKNWHGKILLCILQDCFCRNSRIWDTRLY